MKLTAIVLAATLLLANARCLLACATAPHPLPAGSSCHHRQQPAPEPAPQSCVHAMVIDLAPSPAKVDLVETGVIAGAVAKNVELKAPEFTRGRFCRETSPPISLQLGLSAVLKI
jgi:hypothetical protein